MTIKTRFNIGDKVFFMHRNKVNEDTVIKIEIAIYISRATNLEERTTIYRLKDENNTTKEDNIFASKEDLLKSL